MRLTMKLNPKPFEQIANGSKTVEVRLNDLKRRMLHLDDEIVFINTADTTQTLTVKVVNLHRFKSFEQLYETIPLESMGYHPSEVTDAKPSDMEEHYPKDADLVNGVLAIEVALCDPIIFD
ncbi:ASCH domain-containing protein [Fundicoccus culcitae]|uniref:ASCH domain-containing protein n=1 Tax=Fundicoccus culcitae TaxID=2969821 RepID=A0ABY5P623_9LACT|nr:ASCH domain-containing protein [Fundicoccus culcitae]UUX34129.1 ASCH domain-containing protein [Fundicoccus culcitae]